MSFASICVLSYNRPQYLRALLESLFINSGAPLELIIHDDGSTDPEVAPILEAMRPHATIITNPPGHNQGQGTALNRMFYAAQGDLIIKMDQDVTLHPGWLQEVNRIFDGSREQVGRGESVLGLLGLCHYFAEPVDCRVTKIADWPLWDEHTHILGSAFVVPRSCWDLHGPFPEHSDAFAEDWEFQQRVTNSGAFACGLPKEPLADNNAMGVGPSTIVHGTPGNYTVTKIHHGPVVHGA